MSIFSFFKRSAAPAPAAVGQATASHTSIARPMLAAAAGVVQYPPTDPGLPTATVDELLTAQHAMISRLRTHAAHDPQLFQTRFVEPLARIAGYVSNLPAAPEGLYSGPGGLFRACVELSFGAFQAADGRIFTGSLGVEERHRLEVRWRYVCFLAGLLWPVGRTLEQIKVTTAKGDSWPVRALPMDQWIARNQADRIYCTWPRAVAPPGPASTSAALVLAIAGDAPFRWIEEGSPQLATALLSIVTGTRTEQNGNAFDVVEGMWTKVCAAETARQPTTYGRLQYGAHSGPHLVDAMRSLVQSSAWVAQRSPLFVDATGVYLVWPLAGEEMLRALQSRAPHLATTLGGLLVQLEDSGLIEVSANTGPFKEIADEAGEVVAAVRLTKADSLIDGYRPVDFANCRSVEMSAIRREDPLRAPSVPVAPAVLLEGSQSAKPQLVQPPAPAKSILEPTLAVDSGQTAGVDPEEPAAARTPAKSADAVKAELAPPTQSAKPTERVLDTSKKSPAEADPVTAGGGVAEGAEVRHADSLPKEVRTSLKPFVAEQLAHLIAVCKSSDQCRSLPTGVAVPLTLLGSVVASPPDFLQALSLVGYLHVEQSAPGRLVQDVAIPDGTANKVKCFILSTPLTKKVGL